MVDIEKIKPEIIERLKPLNPDKIILFGSYAYGTPTDESDIDLFLLKDELSLDDLDSYELEAMIKTREDYFYKVDILENAKVLYERNSS